MIIYKTINLINGKCYVGQDSKDNKEYFGSGKLILKALQKYGKENFHKETVAWCDTKDKLDFLEKLYIEYFNTKIPFGYNLTDGGEGNFSSRSIETRHKYSEAKKGNKNPWYGKKNIEHSKRMKGKGNPRFGDHRTYDELYGIEKSLILRENISKQCTGSNNPMFGKPASNLCVERTKESNTGRPGWTKGLTKETDERILAYSKKLRAKV